MVVQVQPIEADFSDVFGPITQLRCEIPKLFLAPSDKKELFLDQVHDKFSHREGVGVDDFEFLKVVGQGAFGKVYEVRKRDSMEIFAMKVVRKDKILEKNQAKYMLAERDILAKVDHPFTVQIKYSFQTKYRLYLILEFINGGHLFFQLQRQGLFREDLARVYVAKIVSAVSHLHSKGIMHRDLKAENIFLGADGHVKLTDFGVAKKFDGNTRSNSMCGTTCYMAPEIVLGKGHDKAADWWSLGILLFEMLTGKKYVNCELLDSCNNTRIVVVDTFLSGRNRQKIQQKIIKDRIKLPGFLSSEAHSLLKGLVHKEASKRLGSEEIKAHKWFKSINWTKLEAWEIQPSFLPEVSGMSCVSNFDHYWTEMSLIDSPASSPKCGEKNPFEGFSYTRS